jgi:M6 family metalloprotease-like protein
MSAMSRAVRLAATVVLVALWACDGSFDPMEPSSSTRLLEVVSGDAQQGLTGRALADSIVVRARTPSGDPAIGIELSWVATAGTLSAVRTTTDERGLARVQWIAGSGRGTLTVTYPEAVPAEGRPDPYRLIVTSEGRPSGACELKPPTKHRNLTLGPTDLTISLDATAPHHAVALFVDFSNAPATRTPESVMNGPVAAGLNRLNEHSYGRARLTVTAVPRWYRFPEPLVADQDPFKKYLMETMKLADPEVDFSQYDLVYLFMASSPLEPFSHADPEGAKSPFVFDGVRFTNVVQFGQDLYTYGAPVFVHETGHVFGLVDLYRYDAAFGGAPGSPIRHVGSWSVMSSAYFPSHPLAWEKRKIGFLDRDQVDCLEGPGGVEVVLQPVEVAGGLKAIAVKLSASRVVVIEARQMAQVTGRALCAKGVLIYEVDAAVDGGEGPINVLGSRETTEGPLFDRCGPWAEATYGADPGEISSFTDARSGISVQVLAAETGGAYRVRVKSKAGVLSLFRP